MRWGKRHSSMRSVFAWRPLWLHDIEEWAWLTMVYKVRRPWQIKEPGYHVEYFWTDLAAIRFMGEEVK